MSKIGMRAKKLDYSRRLQIVRLEEIPDLDDQFARSVPQIQTGVEKEEEEEHHLQRFISASQLDGPRTALYIPVPDASKEVPYYDDLYRSNFTRPSKLIRFPSVIDEVAAADTYDLDEEDDEWIKAYNVKSSPRIINDDQFELIITKLEQLSNDRKDSEQSSLPNLPDIGPAASTPGASAVYDYWKAKRQRLSRSLLNLIKPETKPNDPDPYVCFRRRELRQTRKSRRNDQQSYERLVKLRTEMDRAKAIVDMMRKRDRLKKESILLDLLIFEQKHKIWELKRKYMKTHNLSDESLQMLESKSSDIKRHKKINSLQPSTPTPTKLRISLSGSNVKATTPSNTTVDTDSTITVAPPERKSILEETSPDWSRTFPPEKVLTAKDPHESMFNRFDMLLTEPDHTEDEFVDLTNVANFEPPVSTPSERFYRPLRLGPYHISAGRLRIGRGGRIWIDRPSSRRSAIWRDDSSEPFEEADNLNNPLKRRFEQTDSEESDDEDIIVPRGFMSVPIALYPPQELASLSGTADLLKQSLSRPSRPSLSTANHLSSNISSGTSSMNPPSGSMSSTPTGPIGAPIAPTPESIPSGSPTKSTLPNGQLSKKAHKAATNHASDIKSPKIHKTHSVLGKATNSPSLPRIIDDVGAGKGSKGGVRVPKPSSKVLENRAAAMIFDGARS